MYTLSFVTSWLHRRTSSYKGIAFYLTSEFKSASFSHITAKTKWHLTTSFIHQQIQILYIHNSDKSGILQVILFNLFIQISFI